MSGGGFEQRFGEFLGRAEDIRWFVECSGTPATLLPEGVPSVSGATLPGGCGSSVWMAVQETVDGEVRWLLETVGWVGRETAPADTALRGWCIRAREATGVRWRFRRVREVDFDAFRETNRTLGGLLGDILLRAMDRERARRPPMSANEVRRARDEGRC